ncbi:hypothetical protein C461_14333 [Halorubrum aidingense JCM 13560]|uniref:Small CPxCG-related zinc finger protein n=1 Tax=Halorubrum aidingense JCM 13560 TaxID=1230454 RepID=M0P5C3_9EURY|nr:DUF6276 family protein [Halorubrum aidingense]EMA65281.1 hypothetical protein C461_14333 [Halorubrum aidingense JCM 13560]
MPCPHCTADTVAFAVPPALREHAPAPETAICTRCLRTFPAADAAAAPDDSTAPDFSAVDPTFPTGEAGIALALICGDLESFALNRASIEALVEYAERTGVDVLAALDRLDAADAAFDPDRRRSALLDIL